MVRRAALVALLALATAAGASRLTTFEWGAAPGWPAGTTIELCANDYCENGITTTQHTLDVPVEPGGVIQGRARAHADEQSSPWVELSQTWPASPIGIRATREEVTMAAALSGTPVQWTSGNVTIPSDCNMLLMFYSYYALSEGGIGSASVGGVSPSDTSVKAGSDYDITTGIAIWYNPPTGSQSVSVTFSPAVNSGVGPGIAFAFVSGADTSGYRDEDGVTAWNGTQVTIDSNTTDLVLKGVGRYDGAIPAPGTGWTTQATTSDVGGLALRISSADSPGASSTTAAIEVADTFAALIAISIKSGTAAASTALPRRTLDGPFYGALRGSVR